MNLLKFLNKKNNRNFGYLLASILIILYGYFYLFKYSNNYYLLVLSILFLAIAIKKPDFFQFFNFLWLSFGYILALIMSNVILIIFYYFFLTPIALISRLFKNDSFKLSFKDNQDSFWNERKAKIKQMKYQS